MLMNIEQFREQHMPGCYDGNLISQRYSEYFRDHAEPGDGASVCWWSDVKAYTIVKRTPKTLTLRRCKAILSPEFKPDWVVGGFSAIMTNNEDQTYTYEEDPDGEVIKAHWSERKHGFYWHDMRVIAGRHEFYDYNF